MNTVRFIRTALLALLLVACASTGSAGTPFTPGAEAGTRSERLAQARTWGYQLTGYASDGLDAVHQSGFDVMVIDAGDDDGIPWTPEALHVAATRPSGGTARLMIGYLSIGAAENYRPYWQSGWNARPPAWLLREDPAWPGSFNVSYWNAEWQAIMLAQLDHVIDSGFDGVYLDLVDAYEINPQQPTARADMVQWVCTLAAHARARDPHFLIIPQNASALIRDPGYAPCVDALGNEETYVYAMNTPTEAARQRTLLSDYAVWKAQGKPVFAIDYADTEPLVSQTYARARADGLVPYVTLRDVDVLTPGR
ncbi:MJ1477/TM1410 family putative glycoside hydrolase [Deinococcus sp.]|uniref:MJ1477/TM1410 family putative glycoside hydrolase n=1 Tax=Deinococcus sp. TaxID=47478 RepID=UPI0028698D89|nr:MJ1477/TM1410 family putative glycoside hydrolase [Deinococcus sp.]